MIYREMSISVNGSGIASDDAQKRKQIQQQLILIFHACRCQKHFEINGMTPCSSPHCAMMRDVLSHMSVCNKDKQCPFSHCSTSKRILSHWKRCGKFSCLICAPIKHSNKTKSTHDNAEHEVKNIAINPDATIGNQDKKFNDKCPDYKTDISENKFMDTKKIDKDVRKTLINRIVETILPVKDFGKAYEDERMVNIISHAKNLEKEIYGKTQTIDEYYRLLAENCFIIHKKLCISQKNSENSVNYPEMITKSPNITIDNSTNEKISSDLFSITNKGSSDIDHLNHFEKILQNEYERQRKLLFDDVKDDIKNDSKTKEFKKEIKQEPLVPVIENSNKQDSLVKLWSKEELVIEFKIFFDFVKSNKNAQMFFSQVDTKSSNLLDGSKSNSKPLSLLTISQKLEDNEYENPWSVVDDINILIKNVCIYTKKKGKSKKDFVQNMNDIQVQIDEIMVKLGFCCGRVEVYQPLTLLCCTANVCTINKDSVYYAYQNEGSDDKVPGMLVESYLCCEKCFSDNSTKVSFIAESNELLTVKKELLVKKKNNVEIHEEFVYCADCRRKWHKVCACHIEEIWPTFYCKNCSHRVQKRENKYTAKRLATSILSNFLEKRVNDYLKKNEVTTDNVTIRVLSSVKKVTEVKPAMKTFFGDTETSFPYRSKAIFAFQEYQGKEVCFFGLHVQEYGSDCPEPNRRRVYVAYLDSVKFFEPSKHRTKVYYEILVGYLDYVKKQGYVMAHIWACPPSEGDDYIFHIHPPDQRIPKPKRLQEWYTKMLDKGIQELVIDDYKDVYKDANLSDLKLVNQIPYFEGDFWPNAFEDILKEFEENNRKAKEIVQDDDDNESLVTFEISKDSIGNKKPKKRKQKKTTSIATSKRKKIHDPADTVNELFKKVMEIMEKHKDNFFIIRLHPQKNVINLRDINDTDPSVESELMDGRENFLQMARAKHLEFSNLRRSLYSTLVMCYELHNEMKQNFCYTCNACNAQIETRYHCPICEEFDLCERCYATKKHVHALEMIKSIADGGENDMSNFKSDENCEETKRRRIDRIIKNFEHAATCRDANCKMANCKFFKNWFMYHNKQCKDGVKCSQCQRILRLSSYHAKFCTDLKCIIAYCQQIKQRQKKQENKQRYIQKKILRRRTKLMRCNSNVSNNPPSASAQDIGNNTVNNSVVPYQFVQSSGPLSNSSTNTNIEYNTPAKINNPNNNNQTFNMKSNYIHTPNQNVNLPISSHVNDISNFQMYPNGNYQAINKGYPSHPDILLVENMYANLLSQPDGHMKFNEWLKTNPGYASIYRQILSSRHKPPIMPSHSAIYSSTAIPQNSMIHQRMHNMTPSQNNQSQIPFFVNNPSIPQQINPTYIQEMNNHIVSNNKQLPGMVPNQMSLPMNRMPIGNHPMNNYSPSSGGGPFLMNNINYIPNVQNHQSTAGSIRPTGHYSQISNGTNINHQGSQRAFSKMIAPQKGGLPQQTPLNFQSSNPNDSQLFRSNHQNYFN